MNISDSSGIGWSRLPERPAICLRDPPESYTWTGRNVQVREPRLEYVTCCNFCRGFHSWCPYPVTYEISTMTDSKFLCSTYMVTRRSDEDFIKLAKYIQHSIYGSLQLVKELKQRSPRRLLSIGDRAIEEQQGRHKLFILWLLANDATLSGHALHAFLGCSQNENCPSRKTPFFKEFPLDKYR